MNNRNDFSSIDRLIDLGMGIAMSNQIAQSMNNMMAQISTPPQINQLYRGYGQPGLNVKNQSIAPVAQTAIAPTQVQTTTEVKVEQEFYYVVLDGKQLGPYKGTEIALLIIGKKINEDTLVWKTGTKDWVKAKEYEDLRNLLDYVPPKLGDM